MLWKKKAFDLAQYYKEACERIVILKKIQQDITELNDKVVENYDIEIRRLRKELKYERNLRGI